MLNLIARLYWSLSLAPQTLKQTPRTILRFRLSARVWTPFISVPNRRTGERPGPLSVASSLLQSPAFSLPPYVFCVRAKEEKDNNGVGLSQHLFKRKTSFERLTAEEGGVGGG